MFCGYDIIGKLSARETSKIAKQNKYEKIFKKSFKKYEKMLDKAI